MNKSNEQSKSESGICRISERYSTDSTELIHEQDLPEMTDVEYSKWYDMSYLAWGVRMGPNIITKS